MGCVCRLARGSVDGDRLEPQRLVAPGVATNAVMDPRRWPGAVKNRRRMPLRMTVYEVEILNRKGLLQPRRGYPGVRKEKDLSSREGLETRRGQRRLRAHGLPLCRLRTFYNPQVAREILARLPGQLSSH